MIRKAFVIQAKKGMAAEYLRRHNPIWPELASILNAHGVSNYSIFLNEQTLQLFGYMEIADEYVFQQLEHNEVCRKWWLYMTEVLECSDDNSEKAKEDMLKEIFYLK